MKRMKNNQAGFTMVEISVVIIIIGLLIGGIFLGMNLLTHSRLVSTGARVDVFENALEEFVQRYAALPGDMANATARMPACTGGCGNGNGNNVIDAPVANVAAATGTGENAMFWYHLQAAGLIQAIQPNVPITGATIFGQSHPAAPAGGGYVIFSMAGANGIDGNPMQGIYVRWQGVSPYNLATQAFVVTPSQAQMLDLKFDDGNPLRGNFMAQGTAAAFNAGDGCRANATAYIQGNNANVVSCYMYFKIREASGL